jgi:hypothetical protein
MPINMDPLVAKVTLVGQIFNEQALNVFYYANNSGSGSIIDLLTALSSSLVGPLLSIVSNKYEILRADAVEVKGGLGAFTTLDFNSFGTISGDCLPPYVSWDFTLIRGGLGERNGYKRFAGVAESSQVDGIATTGISASLGTMAAAIGQSVLSGDAAWIPVIRRTRVHRVPQHPPVYYTFGNCTYAKIGSQNSRKFGRGR